MPALLSGRTAPRARFSPDLPIWSNIVFWLAVAALLFRGYSFGSEDQAEQLPFVLRLLDPNFLTRDWFVNSTSGFGPRTFYAQLLALPSHLLGVEATFALLHFLCWGLFVWGVARIVWRLLPGDSTQVSTARFFAPALAGWMFATWEVRVTGANPWLGSLLTPSEIANTLGLWAIVFWIEGRRFAASLLVLVAGGIHPLIGPLGGFTLGVASWWNERGSKSTLESEPQSASKQERTPLAAWVVLAGAIAIPLIAGYLGDRGGGALTPEQKKQAIYVLAFERHSWHYVPWAWGNGIWWVWGLLLGFGLWARREVGTIRLLDGFALVSLGFSLLGWVSILWQPLWPLVKLQPFRMTIWLELAFFFHLALFLGRRLASGEAGQRFSVALWLAAAIFILQTSSTSSSLAVCVFLLVASEVALKRLKNPLWAQFLLLLPLLFIGREGGIRVMSWLYLVPALALVGGAWALQDARGRRFAIPLSLAGIALLAVIAVAPVAKLRGVRDKTFISLNFSQPFVGPQRDVARWAKSNTPADALFLLPPQDNDFRLMARRSIVVNFKTFAWGDKGLLDWRQRISDVTGNTPLTLGKDNVQEISAKYDALSPQQIEALQRKYKFNYVVVNAQKSLNWPLAFQTKEWKVYAAPSTSTATGRSTTPAL